MKAFFNSKKRWLSLILATILITSSLGLAFGDDDDDDDRGRYEKSEKSKKGGFFSKWFDDGESIPVVSNETYKAECGDCHFDYQPELLPKASWQLMMQEDQLLDHFGEELEYDPETHKELLNYMVANAADNSRSKISSKIIRSIRGGNPLKISEVPYIVRKHSEIPDRMITQDDVKTLGNCSACHQEAKNGNYDDDYVEIPNKQKLR